MSVEAAPARAMPETPISPTLARSNRQPIPHGYRGRLFRQLRPISDIRPPSTLRAAAQNETLDLAAWRLRQGCDEVDLARVGMRRKALTHHLLDLRLQVFRAVHSALQHDDCLDDL